MHKIKTSKPNARRDGSAFTLIELLTVISIIALLAGMIIPLSNVAVAKRRMARVQAELNNLINGIEIYKLEVGSYPPDNGYLKTLRPNDPKWSNALAKSPLFYELGGAIFTNRGGVSAFRSLSTHEEITPAQLVNHFGVQGIQNSARAPADVPYRGFTFRPSQYKELASQSEDIEVLAVPVLGPYQIPGQLEGNPNKTVNFTPWFYDSSTTNRQNRQTFDLWTEVIIGKKTNIVGNFKL